MVTLPRVVFVVQLVLCACAALLAASGVSQIAAGCAPVTAATSVTGSRPVVDQADDRDFAPERAADVFGVTPARASGETSVAPAATTCADAPPTHLPLRLVGSVVSLEPDMSAASIASAREDASVYVIGDVVGGARIESIEAERVCIDNAGGLESLALAALEESAPVARAPRRDDTGPLRRVGERAFATSRDAIAEILRNPAAFAKDARFVPAFSGGNMRGFKLAFVRSGSVLANAGLERGDVVTKVNDVSLADLNAAMALAPKASETGSHTIEIERRGAVLTYTLAIE